MFAFLQGFLLCEIKFLLKKNTTITANIYLPNTTIYYCDSLL